MWWLIPLAFTISPSLAQAPGWCKEPALALVADGIPVKHLKLTEAAEVVLLGEEPEVDYTTTTTTTTTTTHQHLVEGDIPCYVSLDYLAVGGGGGYFGAGGGSGYWKRSSISGPRGGSLLVSYPNR